MKPIPILVDTDLSLGTPNAEIDDGAALMLLAHSPEVSIEALTTVHGNAPEEIVAANIIRLAGYLGLDAVPIGRGAPAPWVADPDWGAFLAGWQAQYGPTPPAEGPLPEHDAMRLIIETAARFPGELVILALGPLTNLAQALQDHPALAGMVREVVTMGGSLDGAARAEFNIRCDPEAAQAVLAAGWPVRLHGLEITRQPLFSPADFRTLDPARPAQALLQQQADGWIRIVERQGWEKGGCSLHDAVAAAAVIAPELFGYTSAQVEIETQAGPARGFVRAKPDAVAKTRVSRSIAAADCRTLILERIRE